VGHVATLIAVTYGILGGLAVIALGAVVWVSTVEGRQTVDTNELAEREKTWFAIVVVLLVGLLFATIFFTPYSRGATGGGPAQVVPVRGVQFAWVMPAKPIRVNVPAEFRLSSPDVNHGFAVFDPHGVFLFQVQVIPGKLQLYRWTFHEPGTYRVECFEYCGLGHDQMRTTFRVVR
jgi:cytochrome c oxidase subunit II